MNSESINQQSTPPLLYSQRQKQLKLNDIDTLGYLKMNQMQYFRNLQDMADIKFTLLFDNKSIHAIYAQVGILARETMEIERKHRINVLHVGKMKTDIKFMNNQIIELKRECVEVVYRKFGRMLTLDDLEETVLRRMCYEMRADIKEIKKAYAIQVSDVFVSPLSHFSVSCLIFSIFAENLQSKEGAPHQVESAGH